MDLYADEDVALEVVEHLRRGHDVLYPRDQSTTARSDAWHLHEASRQGRILVTANHTDYKFLHRVLTTNVLFEVMYESHAGILSVTERPDAAEWATAIDAFVRSANVGGRLFIWHVRNDEWLQDQWRPE
jgi:hypothetical protein